MKNARVLAKPDGFYYQFFENEVGPFADQIEAGRAARKIIVAEAEKAERAPEIRFDDISGANQYYLRRLYDMIGEGSLERLVEAIEPMDPGYHFLDVEICRRKELT